MKLKKDGYEVEGTPLEIKEFIKGDNTETPMRRLQKINRRNKNWNDADTRYLIDNWISCGKGSGRGKKARKARKNNKNVAEKIGRTIEACKTHINYETH
jgi:hypothetical protein